MLSRISVSGGHLLLVGVPALLLILADCQLACYRSFQSEGRNYQWQSSYAWVCNLVSARIQSWGALFLSLAVQTMHVSGCKG
jgi:hypothetical protein